MAFTHVFAAVSVADHDAARPWYERFFGRPPDLIPNDHESAWQLTPGGGWLYIVGDPDRAGRSVVTLLVDDIEERAAELERRGLAPGPMETLPGLVTKCVVTDPDGNTIALGQPPAAEG